MCVIFNGVNMSVLCQVYVIHINKIDKLSEVKVRHRDMCLRSILSFSQITANVNVSMIQNQYLLRWLAQILRVFDCLITSLTFPVTLCFKNFTVPAPRSFHWLPALSNRYSFAFLHTNHKHITQKSQTQHKNRRKKLYKITDTTQNYTIKE